MPQRPVSALGKLGGEHEAESKDDQGAPHRIVKEDSGFLDKSNLEYERREEQFKQVWKRERSRAAYSRIPAASLTRPLHPQETLGRGLGTNIAVDEESAQLLRDRDLSRKTMSLVRSLETRPLPLDPLLAELRTEMEEEEAAKTQV